MKSAKEDTRGKIPVFKTREEEARFWDTHDIADYQNELQPARVRFARNLSQGITVRLDPDTLSMLRARASKKGIGPTTLARMWILEHLQEKDTVRRTRTKTPSAAK